MLRCVVSLMEILANWTQNYVREVVSNWLGKKGMQNLCAVFEGNCIVSKMIMDSLLKTRGGDYCNRGEG